ncbi:MAG: hypothetical protein WA004_16885 [Saprospiraceae bacterium]
MSKGIVKEAILGVLQMWWRGFFESAFFIACYPVFFYYSFGLVVPFFACFQQILNGNS